MMRFFVLLLCIIASTTAFTTPPCAVSSSTYTARSGAATTGNLNVMQSPRFMKPTSLGVRLNGEDEEVKVVTMEVDPFTLTAVGFGLIAFNFLVLANMGDAGIGGIVARIMNTFG
eukprot:CAMPEP_0113391118 /NCGR_PEP_ID=MMETSP0013_2-20120614/10537_1 /TAXON_ID=2843 ORGANISM="Skeletonema costatum, Strain 1716" /NCGR_SAMPLE_ID=MMETSP0013_2 /ASSEMBLY_ACC=CAM_ASM_000158 /LENGTH=114 /DNA_ID=CAMNT_0000274335 /DNA_START=21 /DNA_END=365 /DNA_ORIENTATION=+ /assembly_acc=CAM_ASM_000158